MVQIFTDKFDKFTDKKVIVSIMCPAIYRKVDPYSMARSIIVITISNSILVFTVLINMLTNQWNKPMKCRFVLSEILGTIFNQSFRNMYNQRNRYITKYIESQ